MLWRSTPITVEGPTEEAVIVPKLKSLEAAIDREAYEQHPPGPGWDDL